MKEIGRADDAKCDLCGEDDSSILHCVWKCKAIQAKRHESYVCNINVDDLPLHLAMGLPGAMSSELHTTFWGTKRGDLQIEDGDPKIKLGLPKTNQEYQRKECWNQEVLNVRHEKQIGEKKLNARQIFTKIRSSKTREKLTLPRVCEEKAPDEINVYSDGSFRYGKRPVFGLGAAGVWWPKRSLQAQAMATGEYELGIEKQEDDGVQICTCLPGFGSSSTRAEIGAGILALCSNSAVHIGTDSQAFMDKALFLIDLAKRGREPRGAFGSQKDCDLWRIWYLFVKEKGCDSVRITKVKGHAKASDVTKGTVQEEDRIGNECADRAAKKGIDQHGEVVVKAANWYSARHCKYTWLVRDIHTHIIEGYAIKRELTKERDAATAKEDPGKESKSIQFFSKAQQSPSNQKQKWVSLNLSSKLKSKPKKEASTEASNMGALGEFLQRNTWRSFNDNEFGITWIELFVLFKKMGYPNPLDNGTRKASTRKSLASQIKAFKLGIRRLARDLLEDEEQRELFRVGKTKGYALKHLGVASHAAHINSMVKITDSIRDAVHQEDLFLNGNRIKNHGRMIKDGASVRFGKISLKGKVAWTSRVKPFTKEQLEEFEGVGSFKLEGEDNGSRACEERGTKRKAWEVGRRVGEPPRHDFVQPLLARKTKKPSTQQQPVLRIGMLSVKLKERFGHLCT